jgi:hypothetical protein
MTDFSKKKPTAAGPSTENAEQPIEMNPAGPGVMEALRVYSRLMPTIRVADSLRRKRPESPVHTTSTLAAALGR